MADNKGADVLKLRFPEGDPSVMLDSHNLGNGVVLQNVSFSLKNYINPIFS